MVGPGGFSALSSGASAAADPLERLRQSAAANGALVLKFFEAEIGEPAIATILLPEWLFEQANQAMAAASEVPPNAMAIGLE